MRTLIIMLTFILINTAIYSQASDTAKIKNSPKPSSLNGYHTTYNNRGQKSKIGTFKDSMLKDGRSYIYDEKGFLQRVILYKDFQNVGDSIVK